MDQEQIKVSLLDHYTALTQHHRHKTSLLAITYISLSQLMVFTPIKTYKDYFEDDAYIFGIGVASLLLLLTLGILHHICTLAMVAKQRINVLKSLLYRLLPTKISYSGFIKWERDFETKSFDTFSASKYSSILGTLFTLPIFILTVTRFHSIVVYLFPEKEWAYVLLGVFDTVNAILIGFYGYHIGVRWCGFVKTRTALKAIQCSVTTEGCNEQLGIQ